MSNQEIIDTDIQIDIVVLKKLAEVVNVVPVIAKSDSLTLEERYQFKQRVSCHVLFKSQSIDVQIMAEMQHNQIRSYPFDAEENDEEELQLNERIRVSYMERKTRQS